jgi:signal transduction histidine kinase
VIGWAAALAVYTGWRTLWPIAWYGDARSVARVVLDVGLNLLAVVATGFWGSPFVFSLLTAVTTAGLVEGFGFALRVAVTAAAGVTVPMLLVGAESTGAALRQSAQWCLELTLVAAVAGYGRRLFGEAEARHSVALDRMNRLAEANSLLFSLHRVAQDLPASLDLREVLDSTLARLRNLLGFPTNAILLADEAGGGRWVVAAADGARLPAAYDDATLPALLRRAAASRGVVAADPADGPSAGTLTPGARAGLYAPLRARGRLVGLVAVEAYEARPPDQRQMELLAGFLDAAALALDNARWFGRLRTMAADEERSRIARELHDRIGQSIAYVAFELERICRRAGTGDVRDELEQLRADVKGVVTEIREALFDLRTVVSEEQDIVATLEAFCQRVRQRNPGLEVTLEVDARGRLPLPQERELWRICQEAVTNAERHAGARHLGVRWACDGRRALLEVHDDGRGFCVDGPTRDDAYGLVGMRERADAIGATLTVDAAPGAGTTVRCTLEGR